MKARSLQVLIGILAALIFGANYLAIVRAQGACQCLVTVFTSVASSSKQQQPSCSFKLNWSAASADPLAQGTVIDTDNNRNTVVTCNLGIKANMSCTGLGQIVVGGGSATSFNCKDGSVTNEGTQRIWGQNKPTPGKAPLAFRAPSLRQLKGFASAAASPATTIFNPSEVLTVIDGDAGIQVDGDTPRVTVAAGQATVLSLCDGSYAQVSAPSVVHILNDSNSLGIYIGNPYDPNAPTCTVSDINGNWRGAYAALNAAGNLEAIPLVIAIQGNGGSVTIGSQKLNITQVSFSSGTFNLSAATSDQSGTASISGSYHKGGMLFQVYANLPPPLNTAGNGSAERLSIAQFALPAAAVNAPYQHQLYALTMATGSLKWSVSSGSLPGGMSLDPAQGTISGTPKTAGDSNFTVQVSDANGDTFLQPFKLTVQNLTLAATILPVAFAGQPYKYTLQAVGGTPPYQFATSLPLPGQPALSAAGDITWDMAPAQGPGLLVFSVTDSANVTQKMVAEVPVRGITLTGSEYLPTGTVGVPYQASFPVIGASGPVSWSISTDLSTSGLSFDPVQGQISGTPLIPISIYMTVTASDSKQPDTRDFDLVINPAGASTGSAPAVASGGVVNAATNKPPAANGGIGQGSFISIYGSGLGPAAGVTANSLPLSTALGGSTVTITPAGGSSVQAYPVYASATQINGIVPSNTPIGPATVTVTYNSQTSTGVPVQIARSGFGIFTANYGSGPAAAIDLTTPNPFLSATNPAHPGDYLTIFGTGLGPVSVPDNQAPGGAVSPTGLTVQVQVGGQTVVPIYAGRSPQFPAEDQINLQLPATDALATGCAVTVTVTVNGATSNTATLPIAPSGQSSCVTPQYTVPQVR